MAKTRKSADSPTSDRTAAEPRFEGELRRGVLQLAALHLLEQPRYGYDLVRRLGELGFAVEEGTLYPILRRFEKQGILASRWDTAGARPRKYYELSDEGRTLRDAMRDAWTRVRAATDALLNRSMDEDREESTS